MKYRRPYFAADVLHDRLQTAAQAGRHHDWDIALTPCPPSCLAVVDHERSGCKRCGLTLVEDPRWPEKGCPGRTAPRAA
jgi:hypothetical protein